MTDQVSELLEFVLSPNPQVQAIALNSILPYTAAASSARHIFRQNYGKPPQTWVSHLAAVCVQPSLSIPPCHDCIKCLINLATDLPNAIDITKTPGWWAFCDLRLSTPESILADPVGMLLSNLTQESIIASDPGLLKLLPKLADLFCDGAKQNSKANFEFLGSALANISSTNKESVRTRFLDESDGREPIAVRVAAFTQHPSTIRRGAAASIIKNVCFSSHHHEDLVVKHNVLPHVLLPLCGPEEYPLDEMDAFPPEIQLLPEDKTREPDAAIRAIHLEALLLLCSSRSARSRIRQQNVYRVIQVMHKAETDSRNKELATQIVGLLIRDEPPDEEASVQEI